MSHGTSFSANDSTRGSRSGFRLAVDQLEDRCHPGSLAGLAGPGLGSIPPPSAAPARQLDGDSQRVEAPAQSGVGERPTVPVAEESSVSQQQPARIDPSDSTPRRELDDAPVSAAPSAFRAAPAKSVDDSTAADAVATPPQSSRPTANAADTAAPSATSNPVLDSNSGGSASASSVAASTAAADDGPSLLYLAIGDRVWRDADANGRQDDGESGLSGIRVELLSGGSVVDTQYTNGYGYYQFSGTEEPKNGTATGPLFRDQSYDIHFVAPSGYLFTEPSAAETNDANDSNADEVTGVASGVTPVVWDPNSGDPAPDLTTDAGLFLKPTVGASVVQNAVECDAATNGPIPGLVRITRGGDAQNKPLTVNYRDEGTGTADSGSDYAQLSSTATIPAGQTFVDVAIDPADDGIWEWTGPETVNLTVLPSSAYLGGSNPVTVSIGEQGTPTFTPVVDDTVSGADDYSLVGRPVNVGYQIQGNHVLRRGSVAFEVDSGPGEMVGSDEVAFTTDAAGYAYVFTQVVPTLPEDIFVIAQLEQPAATPKNTPPIKPLPAQRIAGIDIFIGSEGSATGPNGTRTADSHVRSVTTPTTMTADRIRPRIATNVYVVVTGNVPVGALAWIVQGQSQVNGTVDGHVAAEWLPALTPVAGPGTTPGIAQSSLPITGVTQTTPGHSGQLQIRIFDGNKPNKIDISSAGFSVSAIPVGLELSHIRSYNGSVTELADPMEGGPTHTVLFGQLYGMRVLSDSGNPNDLDQVLMKEVVGNKQILDTNTPPRPGKGFFQGALFYQESDFPANGPVIDTIAYLVAVVSASPPGAVDVARQYVTDRTTNTLGGKESFDQFHEFEDKRTGPQRISVPNSGFTHTRQIQRPEVIPTAVAHLTTQKKPKTVTINGVTVAAATTLVGADAVFAIDISAP